MPTALITKSEIHFYPMKAPIPVYAFVDWDSARRIAPPTLARRKRSICAEAINRLQNSIAEALAKHGSNQSYRISLRLYHGWHRGLSPTDDRLELEELQSQQGLQRIIRNCSFSPSLAFGDALLCGGKRASIRDTLRSPKKGEFSQKMVDTSLVADLLHNARIQRGDGISVVVGDDDDLTPGLITADAWGHTVLLKRITRNSENKHLNLQGLLC